MHDIRLIYLHLIFSEINGNSFYGKKKKKKDSFFGFISKCKKVNIFHKYAENVIKIVQDERVLKK